MNYANSVKAEIAVGMRVTCACQILDLKEGDTGTVLYIDYTGSLNRLNVQVKNLLINFGYFDLLSSYLYFRLIGRRKASLMSDTNI